MGTSEIEAVDNALRETTPESMDLEAILSEMDLDGIPTKQRVSLVQQSQSLRATIQKTAWLNAGISMDTAGSVDTYAWEEHDLLLIDLSSHEPDLTDS